MIRLATADCRAQFFDEENIDLAPGTYSNLRIDLTDAQGTGESFNDAFGEAGSGSPLIPTFFQFFFNKQFGQPLTLYFDNVRVGMTSAAVEGDYNANGKVDAADYVLWRNGGPLANEVADPGTVSPADYGEWRTRFGNPPGSGSGLGNLSVPEPASALLLVLVGAMGFVTRRREAIF